MRAFRIRAAALLSACGSLRYYGGPSGSRQQPGGRYARGGGSPPPPLHRRNMPNEPQVIAQLLNSFPLGKTYVAISKWAAALPDDLREALVPYGGLGAFAGSQSNFFLTRKENGVTVASLTTMGAELCLENRRKEIQQEKQAEKYSQRRGGFGQRNRGTPPRGSFSPRA